MQITRFLKRKPFYWVAKVLCVILWSLCIAKQTKRLVEIFSTLTVSQVDDIHQPVVAVLCFCMYCYALFSAFQISSEKKLKFFDKLGLVVWLAIPIIIAISHFFYF
jgi:hypothetical protein